MDDTVDLDRTVEKHNTVEKHGAARAATGIRRTLRRHPGKAAAILAALLVAVGCGAVQSYRVLTLASAQSAYDDALAASLRSQTTAGTSVLETTAAITAADSILRDSAGKVFAEEPRTSLATALEVATGRLTAARAELEAAARGTTAPTADAAFFSPGAELRQGSVALSRLRFDAASDLTMVTADLVGPVTAVTDAMALWQTEQDRLIGTRYSNNTHATGWYPELDECTGSVDVTAHYGVPTIAEHWSCGGRDFPDDAGTVITLTGVHAGSYRVEGIAKMLNASRDSTSDLPRGFDLLYQTCQNGQSWSMSFTGLTRLD